MTPKQSFLSSILKEDEEYAGIILGKNGALHDYIKPNVEKHPFKKVAA